MRREREREITLHCTRCTYGSHTPYLYYVTVACHLCSHAHLHVISALPLLYSVSRIISFTPAWEWERDTNVWANYTYVRTCAALSEREQVPRSRLSQKHLSGANRDDPPLAGVLPVPDKAVTHRFLAAIIFTAPEAPDFIRPFVYSPWVETRFVSSVIEAFSGGLSKGRWSLGLPAAFPLHAVFFPRRLKENKTLKSL